MFNRILSEIELTSFCLGEDLKWFISDHFATLLKSEKIDISRNLSEHLKTFFSSHPEVQYFRERNPALYKKLFSAWNNGWTRAQVEVPSNIKIARSENENQSCRKVLSRSGHEDIIEEFLKSSYDFLDKSLRLSAEETLAA